MYPFFYGFTGDLLFYIAIDTLFLTVVKGFTAAQIVSITSFSLLACIVLQVPVLFIIKKIGNTASVRVGSCLLVTAALLITFGNNYFLVLLGRTLHNIDNIFKFAPSVVALKNDLDLVGRPEEFVRVRTAGNTVYAVVTMLISFVASYMFNLYAYLPMFGCITTCTVGLVLSFFIKDHSPYNRAPREGGPRQRVKIKYSSLVIVAILAYSVFYLVVTSGQNEGKLFTQELLLLEFDVETTALIIGAVVCVSRVMRVLSNMVFAKLYKRFCDKMGVALAVLLGCAIGAMLFGSFLPHIIAKITVMALGYTIILFARDPFNLYMQDVIFAYTPKEQHQSLLIILNMGVKIASAGIGLIFSAFLISYPLIVVIGILFGIAVLEVLMCAVLYRIVMREKRGLREKAI
ncbi:MAG: hypothetical protein IJF31_03095 [Clostridia bacterium]|nr:hypothetical protein [Clostridia bacterium]